MLNSSNIEKESGHCGRGIWLLVNAMGHQTVLSGRLAQVCDSGH